MLKVPPLNVKHFSAADACLKNKFQVAGRTTFCQVFFSNPYVIGGQKLPVAGPKHMYNLAIWRWLPRVARRVDFASLKLSKKKHISINIKVFEICFQFWYFPGCMYLIDTCYKVYDICVHRYKEIYTKFADSVGQLLKMGIFIVF